MATLQQNLQRPFYIKHLLERLRYGKAAAAMRREAAELIEKMNKDSSNLSAQNSQQAMEIDELKERAEKAESALAEETEIVNRIWAIYGSPSYEELRGRSIYDLIKADRSALAECMKHADAMSNWWNDYDALNRAVIAFRTWRAQR